MIVFHPIRKEQVAEENEGQESPAVEIAVAGQWNSGFIVPDRDIKSGTADDGEGVREQPRV